jgi:hypothetical protein
MYGRQQILIVAHSLYLEGSICQPNHESTGMSINCYSCPQCGRSIESTLATVKLTCACSHQFQVGGPGPLTVPHIPLQVPTDIARQEIPWRRVLMVAGGFTAILASMAFVALLLIAVDLSKKESASDGSASHSQNLFASKNQAGDIEDSEDIEEPISVSADESSREPLRKAFAALGPRERLNEIKVVQTKGKAHFTKSPNVNTVSLTWQSTRLFKYVEQIATFNMEMGFVLKGNQGWSWFGQKLQTLDKTMVAEQQLFAYSLSLSNLLPLQEAGFDLVTGAPTTVRQRPCYTITVKSNGRPDMVLCFDKDTHLLAKSEFRGRLFQINGGFSKETYFECYYSDYKVTNGVKHWWRFEQFRDGAKYAELNLDNIDFFEKAQKSLFALPGK